MNITISYAQPTLAAVCLAIIYNVFSWHCFLALLGIAILWCLLLLVLTMVAIAAILAK
jgi:hypothetical protein